MSYFRSYFNKNNTLIKDSQVNTAKNPNTEIFYGSGFSKYIFRVNLDDLKSKVDSGEFDGKPAGRCAGAANPGDLVEVRFQDWTKAGKLMHPVMTEIRDDLR